MTPSGRMKRYLSRATQGLPPSERALVQAELKSHLLERIAQYQQEGYSPREAEGMALAQFGSQHGLSLKLSFAHWSLPAGWTTLGVTLTVLGGALWNMAQATQATGTQSVPVKAAQGPVTVGEAHSHLRFKTLSSDRHVFEQTLQATGKVVLRVQHVKAPECPTGEKYVLEFRWPGEQTTLGACQTGHESLTLKPNHVRLQRMQDELQVLIE